MFEMWTDICEVIGIWIICVLASERVAELITTSDFFFPLRSLFGLLSFPLPAYSDDIPIWRKVISYPSKFIYLIITCGWCCSVWCCILFSLWLPGGPLSWFHDPWHMFVPKLFALVGLSNAWHAVFRRLHRGMIKSVELRILDNNEEDNGKY